MNGFEFEVKMSDIENLLKPECFFTFLLMIKDLL